MDEVGIRRRLEAERTAAQDRVRAMTSELDGFMAESADSNADDEHDPEGPTIAYQRAQLITLLDRSRSSVDDLDRALERLDRGDYAVCERCGGRVPGRPARRPAGHPDLRPVRRRRAHVENGDRLTPGREREDGSGQEAGGMAFTGQ